MAGAASASTPVGQSVNRSIGKCKWFNVVKGYGFITPIDGGQDVFVHQSVIQMPGFRSLAEGEEVEYESRPSGKGIEATIVCGIAGSYCRGSERRPVAKKKSKKIRCYNCGDFGSHIAAKCPHGALPKRCHQCKSRDHLIADCPLRLVDEKQDDKDVDNSVQSDIGGETRKKSEGKFDKHKLADDEILDKRS